MGEEIVPTYEVVVEEKEDEDGRDGQRRVMGVIDGEDVGMPLFANRENRELHKVILEMEEKIEEAELELEEIEDRKRAMAEHLKSVEQESRHTQQLLEAKRKELETEKHMEQLAQRDVGRIQTEIENNDGKKEELQSKIAAVQNEIFRANEDMDKYKQDVNFNQEELEQWALAMGQNEDDRSAFERYMKVDDAKTKELNMKIEKLTDQVHEKKRLLDEEITETQAKQIELEKTAEEFRNKHRERQEAIQQWQEVLEQIKIRDRDIQNAGEQHVIAKENIREAKKDLEREKARLRNLEQDCAEMESESKLVDRVLQKKRSEEIKAKEEVDTFRAEVDLLKTEVTKASLEVQSERQKLKNAQAAIEDNKKRIEGSRLRLQQAKQDLEVARGTSSKAEVTATAAEQTLHEREVQLQAVIKQLANAKDEMFKESEKLFKFRQQETNLQAEIAGAQATGKNLTHEIQRLDDEALRQKELVYTAEFQIQQLERRLARIHGVRSDDEKRVLNKGIQERQIELDKAQAQHKMLLNQAKKLENELKTTKRSYETTKARRQELSDKINELKLQNESAESSLEAIMSQKEEVMVKHDLMKLQVKGLKDQLNQNADSVFGLENRKFQLEMSMQERKKEIQVHSEMQRSRAKLAEEERHKVAMEAQECKMKVKRLEKKFATIASTTSLDEDGKERSQAYFVIAAAQKREELQREGDELDAKIRKATREIRALEETLKNINQLNTRSRIAAHRADPTSAEAMELKRVYKESKASRDTAFKKKKELERLDAELKQDQQRVADLNEQARIARNTIAQLDKEYSRVEGEVKQQEANTTRMKDSLLIYKYQHREALGLARDEESMHEKLFRVQMNNQTRDMVLYTLGKLAKEFPETSGDIEGELGKFGLIIPSVPPQIPQQ